MDKDTLEVFNLVKKQVDCRLVLCGSIAADEPKSSSLAAIKPLCPTVISNVSSTHLQIEACTDLHKGNLYSIDQRFNQCKQPNNISHEAKEFRYDSLTGNCVGICKKCGKKLKFYIKGSQVSKDICSNGFVGWLTVVNPGFYLLNTPTAYKKIYIEACTSNKGEKCLYT